MTVRTLPGPVRRNAQPLRAFPPEPAGKQASGRKETRMNINIDRQDKVPVYLQIVDQIKTQILRGTLPAGSTLPSERALAQLLDIHRNTVVKAYSELKSDDWIESRQGVGYIVSSAQCECPVESVPEKAESGDTEIRRSKRVNWVGEIKKEYLEMEKTFDDLFQRFTDESRYSLGSGIASYEVFNTEKVANDIAFLLTEGRKSQYFYSPYKGDRFLRQKLVSFLGTKGIKASAGEIQILSETNQALDFIATLLVRKGDVVLMEEPVSPDTYRAMELAGSKVYTIPVDQDGMRCDILERMVIQKKPRLIFVNSSFHDPTGNILPLERRRKIIEISNHYRIPVVEEDAASELVYEGEKLPPIKTLDTSGNVIYIYSFSLSFLPGLSLAVVVANKELIGSLSYLVSVRLMSTDWMTQKLLGLYLDNGTYYQALEVFRRNYKEKQQIVCEKLDGMKPLGVAYHRPRGGIYIWCKLPDGVDSKSFINRAYNMGVSLLPGYVFYPHKNGGRNHIRINYSYESKERLCAGMDIMRRALEEELLEREK